MNWSVIEDMMTKEFATTPSITTLEFAKLDSSRWLILDVRAPEEYAVSHLHGALNITPEQLLTTSQERPVRDGVLVYCSAGVRSGRAVQRLARHGITDGLNLIGGLFDWANQGLPMVGDKVHPFSARWASLLKPHLIWTKNEVRLGKTKR
jgi:rhodanese-related sulfurtransferase